MTDFDLFRLLPPLLGQSYDDHMQRGRFFEVLGWSLGILAVVILVGGVVISEIMKRKKAAAKQEREESDEAE